MELLACFPLPVCLDAVCPWRQQQHLKPSARVPRTPGDEQAYPVAAVLCTGGSLSFKSLQCYDAAVACASLSSLAVSRPCCEEDEEEQPSEAAPLPQQLDGPAGLASAQGGLVSEARRRETLPLQSQMSFGERAAKRAPSEGGSQAQSSSIIQLRDDCLTPGGPVRERVWRGEKPCKSRSCTQS